MTHPVAPPAPASHPKPLGQNLTEPVYKAVLHALEEDRGRLSLLLSLLHPTGIADLLERLPQKERADVLWRIPQEQLGEVISHLGDDVQEGVLEQLSPAQVGHALSSLESDDIVDIIQNMDEDQADKAMAYFSENQRALLEYPEDSAGGIMQLEVISAPAGWTVAQLFSYLRTLADAPSSSKLATIYITDARHKLLGSLSLGRLVRLDTKARLADVMRLDPVVVSPTTPQADVASLFEKYDLISCAVVDENQHLLGQITIDDVLDVLMEQHERQIMQQAGLGESGDLFAPVLKTAWPRLMWLVADLGTELLAAGVVSMFQGTIAKFVALAVMMPIVAGMGGNAGTQSMTVTVRGLSMKHITRENANYLLRKESLVGLINGSVNGFIMLVGTLVVYHDLRLGIAIFLALVANMLFAAAAGNLVPRMIQRMGRDPAIASGVVVTTITDVTGFFVFLGLGTLLLR